LSIRKKTGKKAVKTTNSAPKNSIKKASIGTRNESSLHKTLKFRYSGPHGKTEVSAGEYIADGKRADGEYIEVQTGSFGPLKEKVLKLAAPGRVRIIHPVAAKKIIEVYDPCERLLYRRKSPIKGSPWNIFDALLYAPMLPLAHGVTIEIVMADITEQRVKDGKGAWRRKGISIRDRTLTAFHESIVLEEKKDYLRFIPFKKNEEFTTSLLAEKANITQDMARKALYVLTKMGIVKRKGKKGNSFIYVKK
jgi:ribosomal protein S25